MPEDRSLSRKVAAEDVAAPHSAGFDAALDQALLAASELGLGSFTVNVEFWAEIEVTNPGTIHEYGVTITPQGG
jgi:hypothetical protein